MGRFEIKTKDRMGITMDILCKIHSKKLNIISMEVFTEKVCIKVDNISSDIKEVVKNEISNIEGVISIKEIEFLSYEEKERKLQAVIDSINKEEEEFRDIIGNSRSIQKLKNITKTIAKSNSTVLLRGESGTGKELFAKAIHNLSERKDKKLVTINCAALPGNLLESELFGYEEGSFTGAIKKGKDGLFKEAHGGTIFLDEIGEMSVLLQAKLLRVLQEGKIRKIGSSKEESIDVRVIAATHKRLETMIQEGLFREDLYYRLNVIPLQIPPLRERLEDIPMLTQFFISKLNSRINKSIKGAQKSFFDELMEYYWPGNIRQLQNVVERAMNLCEGEILSKEDLLLDCINKDETSDTVLDKIEKNISSLKDEMDQYEKEIIKRTCKQARSYREVGKILGISHTAVMNKLRKYNIDVKNNLQL